MMGLALDAEHVLAVYQAATWGPPPTRDFTVDAPHTKWLTDITGHPTGEGKLCLCAIKDCYSNKVVGYSINSRMKASLAIAALRNAIALRSPACTICHSDRGSQGGFKWSS